MINGTRAEAARIRTLVLKHHNWRSQCLNLIASESPLARELMASDLQHRYTNYDEEDPRKRKYAGSRFAKEIDLHTIRLARSIFGAKFAEIRAVSGQITDATAIKVFGKGPVMKMSALNGRHAAAHRYSQSSVVHFDVHEPPFNASRYKIDTDEAMTRIRLLKTQTRCSRRSKLPLSPSGLTLRPTHKPTAPLKCLEFPGSYWPIERFRNLRRDLDMSSDIGTESSLPEQDPTLPGRLCAVEDNA